MSSNAVEPGTRLVDRYRLEEHLGEADGTTYWRAQDELLDRPVGVCLLPAGTDTARRVLRAARRAAALTDARFLRVLDASEVDDVVYVVSEWVVATNLVELLADGPLPPAEARELALDVAEALRAAHREGLAHLCLTPEHVLRTTHGQVKVGGLAVDAAVHGVSAPDPAGAERLDTQGAAAVAYAALTARWPGVATTGLPAAPHDGAVLCSPRQVRAGIPHDLDVAVCRALDVPGSSDDSLVSLDELVDALAAANVPGRPDQRAGAGTSDTPVYPTPHLSPYEDQPPRRRSRGAVVAWVAVGLVLAAGLALAGGQVLSALRGGSGADAGPGSGSTTSPSGSPQPTGAKLEVKAVTSFDPPPAGNGDENGYAATRVTDGNRATVWTTKSYKDPFGPGGLKDGVGLVLDLGSSQQIGSVTVWVTGGATDLELRASDQQGSSLSDFTAVTSTARDVDGRAVFVPKDPLKARYLLVWLTKLPNDGSGYRGQVSEITVRG